MRTITSKAEILEILMGTAHESGIAALAMVPLLAAGLLKFYELPDSLSMRFKGSERKAHAAIVLGMRHIIADVVKTINRERGGGLTFDPADKEQFSHWHGIAECLHLSEGNLRLHCDKEANQMRWLLCDKYIKRVWPTNSVG